MNYKHLGYEQRYLIQELLSKRYSLRSISKLINVNASTISREIKRNSNYFGNYNSWKAQQKAKARFAYKNLFRFKINFKYERFSKIFVKKYDKKFFGIKATHHYINLILRI